MKVFIIGGSRFIGPILVEKLVEIGHSVTVFNRGTNSTAYPPGVKHLKGDRDDGFGSVGSFDAVIDMCAYNGVHTKRALNELRFDFFVHMGTAAAYKKTEIFPLTESSPLGDWPLWGGYNRGKVECERVLEASGADYASLRPVYILGSRNYVNREFFIYSKLKKNLPIVLPGDGKALVQFVSSEDVAAALLAIVEGKLGGAWNCSADEVITLTGLVQEMGRISGSAPILRYGCDEHSDGTRRGAQKFPFAGENFLCSNEKIKNEGMRFSPLVRFLRRHYESYYQKITG